MCNGEPEIVSLASLGVTSEIRIEEIRIVQNFQGVFPSEIPAFPPCREVEFFIDLQPGTGPSLIIIKYQNHELVLCNYNSYCLFFFLFKYSLLIKPVPWPLRNRWRNVLVMIKGLNFIVSNICREGNMVADLFANQGLTIPSCTYWNDPPLFVSDCMNKNKLGLPNIRYVVP
jgi:hypothetical protein